MSIEDSIAKICRMSRRYSIASTAYRPSSGEGAFVMQLLDDLTRKLSQKIDVSSYKDLQIFFSKGQGNVPRIFWIGIVPVSRTVSTSLSATICFGKSGEGVIAGVMLPRAGVFHNLTAQNRTGGVVGVDVDGDKAATKYNDSFINPKEWMIDNIREDEIVAHLRQSVVMLRKFCGDGANGYALIQPRGNI